MRLLNALWQAITSFSLNFTTFNVENVKRGFNFEHRVHMFLQNVNTLVALNTALRKFYGHRRGEHIASGQVNQVEWDGEECNTLGSDDEC
jgi:hypothetical protein